MTDIIIFHLKRFWEGKDLWQEILTGRKTSEWRDEFSWYWVHRLFERSAFARAIWGWSGTELDVTSCLKVHKAWFVVGYPKNSLPRIEADIRGVIYHRTTRQFEIKIGNMQEVTKSP